MAPEPEPASCGGTLASTDWNSEEIAVPMPKPQTKSGTTYCQWSTAAPVPATTIDRIDMPTIRAPAPTAMRARGQRPARRPDAIEAQSTPSGKGTVVRPDSSGDRPKPVCRKTASTRKKPATPEKKMVTIPTPSRKLPLWSSVTGRSWLRPRRARRRWCEAKAAAPIAERPIMPKVQAGQPSACPSISGKTSRNTVAAARSTPPMSWAISGLGGVRGRIIAAAATVARPKGMLTRKIGRQSRPQMSAPISTPPVSGPATEARPAVRPNSEKAKPRSCGGNITCAIASTCGIIMAPASPCSTRAAISVPMSGARPHRAEKSVNSTTPARKTFLRPIVSPSRPKGSRPSAKAST
jgi:hypothetical protein